jgi:osmoprotectant transport system substrate-binding protein
MQVRRSFAAVLAVGSILLATACAGSDLSDGEAADDDSSTPAAADKGAVRIASQSWPEAALVASMYDELLTADGYDTDLKLVDTRDVYMATFPGSVDVVPEYVGGIVNFLNAQANGAKAKPFTAGDGQELADQGKSLLDDAGATLLDQSSATDTNAFFVTKEYSESEGVTKLSDLTGKSVVLAAAPDCEGRLDCQAGLSDDYGIDITKILPLGFASDQTYQAVLDGEAQLGLTSTTDGTLEGQGLVLLDDDKAIQPAQNLVPMVSTEFLNAHPDVADALNSLMGALDTETLTELNGKVSIDRAKPEDVAHQFLVDSGLLG